MKVLVTGAGGMVGSHMVELLYKRGDEVVGIWHKNKKNIEQITLPIKFVQCDLRYAQGIDELIMDFMPEQIYHLAAQSYPTVSWVSPTETIDVNINSTINIYEAIKKARKYKDNKYNPIVVVACSSAEYGETLNQMQGLGEVYVKETAQLQPLHPYGVSKVGQDLISFQYFMNDHIRCAPEMTTLLFSTPDTSCSGINNAINNAVTGRNTNTIGIWEAMSTGICCFISMIM